MSVKPRRTLEESTDFIKMVSGKAGKEYPLYALYETGIHNAVRVWITTNDNYWL